MEITDPALVREAFADPSLTPPPPQPGNAYWLRSRVARFSSGPDHDRRRALAVAEIAHANPARAAAAIRAGASVRQAVVAAFGVPDKVADLVIKVGPSYFDPSQPDDGLDELIELICPGDPEVIAARIGVLVQACEATAALVENNLQPPPRTTKRIAPDGTLATLHLTGNPFGAPPRECPGREEALAIAAAIIEELRS